MKNFYIAQVVDVEYNLDRDNHTVAYAEMAKSHAEDMSLYQKNYGTRYKNIIGNDAKEARENMLKYLKNEYSVGKINVKDLRFSVAFTKVENGEYWRNDGFMQVLRVAE